MIRPIPRGFAIPAVARGLLAALGLVVAAGAQAAGAPEPFFTVGADGPETPVVHSVLVSGDRMYIAGAFDSIRSPVPATTTARGLVAINLATMTVLWTGEIDIGAGCGVASAGVVHTLALSPGGASLYVGGDFECVRGATRAHLAAVNANNGTPLNGWAGATGPGGPVLALVVSADGQSLYAGGEFGLASVNPLTGALLPWNPDVNGAVHALAADDANARVFAGGAFGLAAIGMTTAAPTAWNPGLAGPDPVVHALRLADDRLYVGGEFTEAGGEPRANLAAFEIDGADITLGALDAPVSGGAVRALAPDSEGRRLYIGGGFTNVDGEARGGLAAIGVAPSGADEYLLTWNPGADGEVHALAFSVRTIGGTQADRLYGGGAFGQVGGEAAEGLVAFPVTRPATIADPEPGGHQALTEVLLDCEDADGIGCARICVTADGSAPAPDSPDCTGDIPVMIPIPPGDAVTTLRFFSEDDDGNRELVRTGRYAIDNEAPVTTVEPSPLPAEGWYGLGNLDPLEMECDDNLIEEFGCTTYYTLDGALPTPDSPVYDRPVSLATLFPSTGDPLQDVAQRAGMVTLRVFSVDDAGNPEDVRDLVYRIDLAAPIVSPSLPSGTYVAPLTMTLDCNDGNGSGCAEIRYTTDGRAPTTSSARYDNVALVLDQATTLRVLAIDQAGNASTQTLGVYALSEAARDTRSGVGALDPLLLAWLTLAGLLLAGGRRFSGGSGACR